MMKYLGDSVAYSALWGVAGYTLGLLHYHFFIRGNRSDMEDRDILRRMRKRDRLFGTFFIVVGIGMVLQTLAAQSSDDRQDTMDRAAQECLIEQVTAITEAIEARTGITSASSERTREAFSQAATAIEDGDPEAVGRAFEAYVRSQEQAEADRKENPIPPFPSGKCE